MDKSTILNLIFGMLPAIWGALGPVATVAVTAFFNSVVKAYVPREIQIPLAGLLSAAIAGLAGADPAPALVEGSAIQSALSMSAAKFLASAPVKSPRG